MPNPSVRMCIGSPSYSEYRSLHNVVSFYIATLSSTTDSFMCPAKTTVASLKFFQEYRCIYAQGPLQLLFSLLGIFLPLIATRFGLLLDAGKTKCHFFSVSHYMSMLLKITILHTLLFCLFSFHSTYSLGYCKFYCPNWDIFQSESVHSE